MCACRQRLASTSWDSIRLYAIAVGGRSFSGMEWGVLCFWRRYMLLACESCISIRRKGKDSLSARLNLFNGREGGDWVVFNWSHLMQKAQLLKERWYTVYLRRQLVIMRMRFVSPWSNPVDGRLPMRLSLSLQQLYRSREVLVVIFCEENSFSESFTQGSAVRLNFHYVLIVAELVS